MYPIISGNFRLLVCKETNQQTNGIKLFNRHFTIIDEYMNTENVINNVIF